MDLNSDDSLLATGSLDSTVKVFNTTTGKPVLSISVIGHQQAVPPSVFLQQALAQHQQANKPRETGSARVSLAEDEEGGDSVESVAFSGKSLLALGSVNGVFEIWDVAAGVRRPGWPH